MVPIPINNAVFPRIFPCSLKRLFEESYDKCRTFPGAIFPFQTTIKNKTINSSAPRTKSGVRSREWLESLVCVNVCVNILNT